MTVDIQAIEVGTDHAVTFYERDDALCRTVAEFLSEAIERGGAGIAIATEPHRRAIEAELRARIDVAEAFGDGTLVLCDAAGTMAGFMSGGRIDASAFRSVIGSILRDAAEAGTPVRAYGEMVALLWDGGDVLGAIELEELWNALASDHEFSLLCGYRSSSVNGHEHEEALEHVCRLHSCVLTPAEPDAREVAAEFGASDDAPKAARRLVVDALRGWGLEGSMLDDAQLVLSELATNAIRHARSGFSVAARRTDSGVLLSVRDSSAVQPTVRNEPTDASGRGLRIVSALASTWGVEHAPEGKTVWAELRP